MTADSDEVKPGSTPDGCLDLAALDALAASTVTAGSLAESHLRSCDRCRELLGEMRNANKFLDRFKSAVSGDSPPRPLARGSQAPSDSASIRIRGYQVQNVLAFGGQGAVYRAVQAGTGRAVAIKVPLGDSQRRPSIRYRFEREIELTAKLDHPAIVRVFGACELDDGRVGCVMECIEGQRFDAWAEDQRAEGRVSVRGIVEATVKIVDAISFAHQRGVLHRDIKPSNVIVTAEGLPYVLDFGLAKALGDSKQSFETLTGAFVGTLAYAAPEQIIEGSDAIDIRTDVYAIGLLLYQALTGRLPYDADTSAVELLRQIRELPPPLPSSFSSAIDDDLDAILLMALAKEKDRRYAAAAELRDDLVAWLEGRAVRARLDSRWYVLRKAVRRHRLPIGVVAASVLVLAATVTLGLIAREQANRATLADAVRDARVLESHWVRLSEARSTAMDNFEAGERSAWDALLDPEPVLVESRVEGMRGDAAPSSPAYWALWEIYQRTPVLFTAPTTGRQFASLDSVGSKLITADLGSMSIDWWDWRTGRHVRALDTPELAEAIGFSISPAGTQAIIVGPAGPAMLIDLATGTSVALPHQNRARAAHLSNDRAIVINELGADRFDVVLWDIAAAQPSEIARDTLRGQPRSLLFDVSRRAFAACSSSGDLLIADATTGQHLYSRSEDEVPQVVAVHSRGVPDEFILYGPEVIVVLDARDPQPGLGTADRRSGFLEGVRFIASAGDSDRYVVTTDRWRVGVGSHQRSHTEGTLIPALSAAGVALSDDGRVLATNMRPSGRAAILDLEAMGARRLPFPAPVTTRGFATVFDVEFDDRSRALLAGAMDGSVRTFGTTGVDPVDSVYEPLTRGVTALRTRGPSTFVGTHDMGRNEAAVLRLDAEGAHTLLDGQRWICGMEIDADGPLWVLTGGNELHKLDPSTGRKLGHTTLDRHPDATTRALARVGDLRVVLVGPAGDGLVILDEETLEPAGAPVATQAIRCIAVSPADPTLIATTADDGMIRLWRLHDGPSARLEPLGVFGAHAGAAFGLAFSPDGRILATGGGTPESKDIRLWDVEQRRELAAFDLFELGVFDLAWSPDGRWIAAGGEVRLAHPEEGGQLYLIDRQAPDRCIAGNLEYHIARFVAEHGREPSQARALRAWAARVLRSVDDATGTP